ncbi:DUF2914 domain-containing protein [Patescibacteria group bacterium]|jgi:hypothetical protein|nr:DUF2914 domain-containing protein [Patescibacteria group bacterium]
MFLSIREFVQQHEKWFSWGAFLTGFTWDNFTLDRIDQLLDNVILIGLLTVATIGIVLWNRLEEKKETGTRLTLIQPFVPLLFQFALGGLFSGLLVFYSRSGTIVSAWPFLLLLAALLIGNEFFRHRYQGVTFQLSIYYIALLSLCVLLLPVFLNQMGPGVFLLSSALSLGLIVAVVELLKRFAPTRVTRAYRSTIVAVVGICLAFQGLYFTNILPPIPLSLKFIGAFHDVENTGAGYRVTYEKPAWWEFWRESDTVIHWQEGEALHCFASVFAPTDLTTRIQHRWQYQTDAGWHDRGTIPYRIIGGRDGGYRGYTFAENVADGRWRCRVETDRGQLIGLRTFRVEVGEQPRELVSELR